jgi:hypothetical protein
MKRKKTSTIRKLASDSIAQEKDKVHPWRLCPIGEHWVRTHSMQVPPSKTHPEGYVTNRQGHCARNPSRKDHLYKDEVLEISSLEDFLKTKEKPGSSDLDFKGKGNQYDDLIAGWIAYWNDLFPSKTPLDPDLVKALISTESGFNPKALANKKNQNSARGLMQLTNATRKILGNEKGELKEHFVSVTRKELDDPSINICAGVRWLHHKRKLLSSKLKREATWEETINAYKGGNTVSAERAKELLDKVYKNLEVLKKCEKE